MPPRSIIGTVRCLADLVAPKQSGRAESAIAVGTIRATRGGRALRAFRPRLVHSAQNGKVFPVLIGLL